MLYFEYQSKMATNMYLSKVSSGWIPLQKTVFTRWVQNHLGNYPDVHINDITKDLSNGVALVDLAIALTGKDTPRHWASNPKYNVEKVQNCDLALDMFTKDGVQFVGMSGKDISDNNEKLILGLIWTLILHYSIAQSLASTTVDSKQNTEKTTSKTSGKGSELMSWAIERTSHYPNTHNFKPYELSLCALLDSYVPEKVNYYSLDPNDSSHNSRLATDVMTELGIPIYIYPDDISRNHDSLDEKTILTQLSSAKVVLDKLEKEPKEIEVEHSNSFSDEEVKENEIHTKAISSTDVHTESSHTVEQALEVEPISTSLFDSSHRINEKGMELNVSNNKQSNELINQPLISLDSVETEAKPFHQRFSFLRWIRSLLHLDDEYVPLPTSNRDTHVEMSIFGGPSKSARLIAYVVPFQPYSIGFNFWAVKNSEQ